MFQQLSLVTLFVLVAHALVLLGLPYWARTVPAAGNPSIFLIRAITSPLQPAGTTAPIASRQDFQPPKPLSLHPRPHPSLPLTPLVTGDDETMPSAPPSPSGQTLSTAPSARQSNPSGADVPDARAPEPIPLVQLPRPAQLAYQAIITKDGQVMALPSTIDWKHDDQSYDLRWTLAGSATGEGGSAAAGRITAHGLAPKAVAASLPLSAADALDPLSAWIELGALIAANPPHYLVGSRISLPVATGDGLSRQMDYIIVDDGDVDADGLFAGESLPALHLVHAPADPHDSHIELWLGKLFDYLPIRLIIIKPDGERLDMTLQSAYDLPAATVSYR